MADKYANWAELKAAEVAGTDYQVISQPNSSDTSHIAIHGGGIEGGSGELAKAVGAALGHQIYVMEALKSANNSDLHITSTHFDEPLCVAMQNTVHRTVSYHGASGDTAITYLGGMDTTLRNAIGSALTAAGFTVSYNAAEEIAGTNPENICNRNLSGAGVQLEMTTAQRAAFFPALNNNAARADFSKRTDAFYKYADAVAAAVGKEARKNTLNVWNGSSWVDVTPQTYTGGRWRSNPPLYFDGVQWMQSAPSPQEYASYSASNSASYVAKNSATLALPSEMRTNDFVVSICAQQDGPSIYPRLTSPGSVIPTLYTLSNGVRLHVAVWPWEPSRGTSVTWDVTDSDNTACMNLVYRYGDVANSALTPVVSLTQKANVNQVALPATSDFTNLYVGVTVSSALTGASWPQGVTSRSSVYPTFGTKRLGLIAADTPGAGASPGSLQFDATVDIAAVALIQIPGRSDGKPTWVLGDDTGSVLGSTTYLG
ncbi:poly-gamma-glutamate hydrolase family protein [Streptomyces malaysiensis]|uniref:poly-gamma-glutamate hydrolase family protein n=1 Tax=Streptomyces malaysiensis TaxID=92644 RepID=UPI0036BD2697